MCSDWCDDSDGDGDGDGGDGVVDPQAGASSGTDRPDVGSASASTAPRPAEEGGVTDACELAGIELRSFLVLSLRATGGRTMRVKDLVSALNVAGFVVAGRASKVISDALRWEVARGRVLRVGRGVYRAFNPVPRTTLRRMKARVAAARRRERSPVRVQPLREPRPLVRPDGPWRYRLRYGLAPPRRPDYGVGPIAARA